MENYTSAMIIGAISDTFWISTYILVIRRCFIDKTFGIPLIALCTNTSWEFIFSFIFPYDTAQLYVNIVWFLLDLVILYQYIKFGKKDFKIFPESLFYPMLVIIFVFSFGAIIAITYEFNDFYGNYSAFADNMIMSILFVWMLFTRNSIEGQSIYIAASKFLGTLLGFIAVYLLFLPSSIFLDFLYSSIFVFDIIYLTCVYLKHQENKINPWMRA